MKLKETIKTIILTGLVISSLVLSGKIWFSKELWPDGYNSFNYASNSNLFSKLSSIFDKNNSKALELSQIFSPKQILINKDSKNLLILPDHNEAENLNNILKENLKTALLEGEFLECTEDEYKKASKSSSVFIDFYNYISFEMLADYYGAPVNSGIMEIYNVKHILFHTDGDTTLKIFAKNNKTSKLYKAEISVSNKNLNSLCDSLLKKVREGTVSSSFAFENNFDVRAEGDSKKLLLDSYMLINLNPAEISNIKPVVIMDNNNFNSDTYQAILSQFEVNASSARRFADASGTVNFIENFATLKFHKDGLLEYTCLNESEGIELKGSFTSDYDVVKLVGEFTENLNRFFHLPDRNKYIFSGVEQDSESHKYTVCFDILYDGVPVIIKRNLSNTETLNHAIEIEFLNGRIVSYNQLFCGFDDDDSKSQMPPMITALDEFYTFYDVENKSDVVINDIYNIYHFDTESGNVETKCAVTLSNKEVVIVNPE